ncbi:MAG: hypothetical protein H8E66_01385 [Planctomycetes bacterium]|nr:hypothetical protein [Planctomycetota bacterium]
MSRKIIVSFMLLASVATLVCETATAIPRRRRANYYYYSSGFTQIANKVDDETASYRPLEAYFDYDAAQSDEVAFADKIHVFLNVWDKEVLASDDSLVAEVKITDTSDYETSRTVRVPITLSEVADEEYQLATFELTNADGEEALIQPATVYRLFISLHRKAAKYSETTAWGRVPGPYYVVTSGDTDLMRARHQIVMRTFREWYYTERGWNRNASYPMDCHAYYLWATGACTVGASNGWTNLGPLFGTYHGGGNIADLMASDRIHGDYVRKPGHTFMLLSYDAEMGHVWTMEANFNQTIEVCIRSVDSGWTVGHLEPDHIRADLFKDVADSDGSSDATAWVETSLATDESVASQ